MPIPTHANVGARSPSERGGRRRRRRSHVLVRDVQRRSKTPRGTDPRARILARPRSERRIRTPNIRAPNLLGTPRRRRREPSRPLEHEPPRLRLLPPRYPPHLGLFHVRRRPRRHALVRRPRDRRRIGIGRRRRVRAASISTWRTPRPPDAARDGRDAGRARRRARTREAHPRRRRA